MEAEIPRGLSVKKPVPRLEDLKAVNQSPKDSTKDLNVDLNPEYDSKEGGFRSKSSLRMVYEAQSQVIQRQIGDLEMVREKLGLNARKICQLLLVDPSAWNRWTRPGSSAPPHIWRALQWYMIVQEKLPGLTPQFFIERVVTRVESKAKSVDDSKSQLWAESLGAQTHQLNEDMGYLRMQSQNLLLQIEDQTQLLKTQAQQIQRLKLALVVGLCLCFGLVLGLLSYQFQKSAQPAWQDPAAVRSAN